MLELTDLEERVLATVDKLSGAQVTTYGDLAHLVGTSPRHVGRIMATKGHLVEWWRVVRADGACHASQPAEPHWDDAGISHQDGRVNLAAHRVDY